MDAQRKNIQNLTELLDEKRNELNDLYRRFGEKLLQDAASSEELALILGRERVDTWKSLMDSRENDTRAILEIKDVLARSQELRQFHQEIEKNRSDIDDDYQQTLEKLGHACYERYSAGDSASFAEIWEKASLDGAGIVELENKRDTLRMELEKAGVLQRVMLQMKLAAVEKSIKQHHDRMIKILTSGARRLVEEGVLEKQLEDGELDEQFEQIMMSIRDTLGRQRDLDERQGSLKAEKDSLDGVLEKYGARDNPSRRIDSLHAKIRDTDRRITMLSVMAARDYVDTVMDDEGERKLTENETAVERIQPLEQVAALRAEIANTRKNIEILEADLKIAALDRTLANTDRSCADFEKKIQQYREQIEKMEKTREQTVRERTALEDYRDSIRKTLR